MHTDKAIAEFEAWWDKQPHREQFEDVKQQFCNVAVAFYQKGREDVVIELPHRESMMACPNTSEEFDSGYGVAVKHCRAAIEAAGIPVRNEQ